MHTWVNLSNRDSTLLCLLSYALFLCYLSGALSAMGCVVLYGRDKYGIWLRFCISQSNQVIAKCLSLRQLIVQC